MVHRLLMSAGVAGWLKMTQKLCLKGHAWFWILTEMNVIKIVFESRMQERCWPKEKKRERDLAMKVFTNRFERSRVFRLLAMEDGFAEEGCETDVNDLSLMRRSPECISSAGKQPIGTF